MHLVPFGVQNRTFGPYFAALHRILISAMCRDQADVTTRRACDPIDGSTCRLVVSPPLEPPEACLKYAAICRIGQVVPILQPFIGSSFQDPNACRSAPIRLRHRPPLPHLETNKIHTVLFDTRRAIGPSLIATDDIVSHLMFFYHMVLLDTHNRTCGT
jgi:hypothetical protein